MIIDNIFFIVTFLNMQCLAYEIKMYKLKKLQIRNSHFWDLKTTRLYNFVIKYEI